MPIGISENGELVSPAYRSLRSEAMSDLISRKPGFLGKWALLIFLLIFLLLITATWFIHFPDIIKARATLIATNAPKEIVVLQDGRLLKLFIHQGDSVKQGQFLGFVECNGKHEQVIALSSFIDSTIIDLRHNTTQNILRRFDNNFDSLGELQKEYQLFITAYQQFVDYLQNGFYLKKKTILNEDLAYIQKNHTVVLQQKELILKDVILSEESYKANASLLKDRVISKQDERNEQSKFINKQMSLLQINTALLSNETQEREKLKEISDLEHTISMQKNIFLQASQTLQSQISDWKKRYIIEAPASGRVTFLKPIQENIFLKSGKSIGFVSPSSSQFYAEITLPQYNFGKVITGQSVQLRFDAYPYQEFGYVSGQLSYVSDIASDSGFLGHIELKEGLITNQKKSLYYREGLIGEAQIITKDVRLIERFYYNIVSAVKK
jgi:HlyD family secretion protein